MTFKGKDWLSFVEIVVDSTFKLLFVVVDITSEDVFSPLESFFNAG